MKGMNGAHVDTSTGSDCQRAFGTPLKLGATSSCRPFSHSTLPISTVPHLHSSICARRSHIASTRTRINTKTNNWTKMGEKLNGGMREVRCP